MIVQEYEGARGKDWVKMAVSLEGGGRAALFIEAAVVTTCGHGKVYERSISAEVACTSKVCKEDLDELEWAIRGKEEPAMSLAWRTVDQLLVHEGDPCQ